jgi:putative transposase
MKNLKLVGKKSNRKLSIRIDRQQAEAGQYRWADGRPIDSQEMLLSLLLPANVKEFYRQLEGEVSLLCGSRYDRDGQCTRWGIQNGSVYLGGQKVAIKRQRVRDAEAGREVMPEIYRRFQDPRIFEERVFRDGLRRVSQRDYKKGVEMIGGAFGFGKSTVSKHWKRATSRRFDELQKRDLSELKIAAVFIDGKRFGKLGVVVALGVSEDGKKYTLGIYQANTENAASCLELLDDLERRGLPRSGLLFIVDGGSGINSALEQKYAVHKDGKRLAVRLRCYNHKWRNIEDVLGKDSKAAIEAASLFWAMREAKDAVEARAHAAALKRVLKKANVSALRSFEEAEQDLLMLHSLGLSQQLKRFFSTTNPIESLNSLLEEDLRRVKRWRDSEHFQRWLATAATTNEKRMHRIRGFKGLGMLLKALARMTIKVQPLDAVKKAA